MDDTPTTDETTDDPAWLAELLAAPDDADAASLWLSRRLRDAGLAWTPRQGDRFVIPDRGLDDTVFLVAPMVVEVRQVGRATLIAFNGTTEWALDQVLASEVLWLPTEGDLRRALGERFVGLRREDDRWVVDAVVGEETVPFEHPDAVAAYAGALLAVLDGEPGDAETG